MIARQLDHFLEQLRREFPEYPVVVLPYTNDDDPIIQHFIHVLGVPPKMLRTVTRRALRLAIDLFGPHEVPLHLTTLPPETSAQYFPEEYPPRRFGWTSWINYGKLAPADGHAVISSFAWPWTYGDIVLPADARGKTGYPAWSSADTAPATVIEGWVEALWTAFTPVDQSLVQSREPGVGMKVQPGRFASRSDTSNPSIAA